MSPFREETSPSCVLREKPIRMTVQRARLGLFSFTFLQISFIFACFNTEEFLLDVFTSAPFLIWSFIICLCWMWPVDTRSVKRCSVALYPAFPSVSWFIAVFSQHRRVLVLYVSSVFIYSVACFTYLTDVCWRWSRRFPQFRDVTDITLHRHYMM